MAMSSPSTWSTRCNNTGGSPPGSGSISWTHTPGVDPSFVIACAYSHAGSSPTVSSLDYGGDALSEMVGLSFTFNIARKIAVWGGPTTKTGAQTVTATFPTTSLFLCSLSTMTGGGLSVGAPSDTNYQSGSSTSSTITLASPDTDAMCVDVFFAGGAAGNPTVGPSPQALEFRMGFACFLASDFVHGSSERGADAGVDMTWDYSARIQAAHAGVVIVDAAEGIVDGFDPPDPFEAPGGGGSGYPTGVSFPTFGVKGLFFPEPYYLTKTGVALARQLNRLRIY